MKNLYKITLDRDWGSRGERRLLDVYIEEEKVIPSNLEKILKKYKGDPDIDFILGRAQGFNDYKFGYNCYIEKIKIKHVN